MKNKLVLSVLLLFAITFAASADVLVSPGSVWKYLDDGSDQGTAWRASDFSDASWNSGPAQLGYGDGDESTIVDYGPNPNARYITTYFRRVFTVTDATQFAGISIRIIRDDGAVVYLNGNEIFRTNMPSGTITSSTRGTNASPENAWNEFSLPNTLVSGTNTLAVEIHNSSPTNSDISFDLELTGDTGVSLIRGPYLQLGTHDSMVVRWRTNGPADSVVKFGTSLSNLDSQETDPENLTEHEIKLTGLQPATKYFYSVGSSSGTLAGGNSSHFFVTSPSPGTDTPSRIWILGDSGTANSNARAVRDAYYNYTGSQYTNLWLMLGDNAYESGTDAEYQAAVFNIFPAMLRQSPLWPTLGNHDGLTSDSPTQTGPYYEIFTLPKLGEAGGVPSGTEAYYSFDYANIHFICLDSYDSSRSTTGPMLTWLKNDLDSITADWTIAFWHHPPYSKGSHDSDVESRLLQMRQNVLPLLEAAGVDLVLSGHSHSYERSFLIDGHYGKASTFLESMKKEGGSGRDADPGGVYNKASSGSAPHEGAVYTVAGSSGQISGGQLNHPAMYISLNLLGSVVLDINGNRLDAKFLDKSGVIKDSFAIEKGDAGAIPAPPSNLAATVFSSSQIALTWNDNSDNESGFRVERSLNGNSFSSIATLPAGTVTYTDSGLTASTEYYYRIAAFNAAGSSLSDTVNATTFPPAGTPPAAPTLPSAAGKSKTTVLVKWVDNSNNEQGFKIERSPDAINFTQVATVGANVTSYTDSGLVSNTVYYYRIRAYNEAGNSAYTRTVSAITWK